jgi:hypothetical protein
VIATDAITEPFEEDGCHDCEPPDFGDGALHLLKGALVDPLIDDMRLLGNAKLYFADPERAPSAPRAPPRGVARWRALRVRGVERRRQPLSVIRVHFHAPRASSSRTA